MHLHRNTVSDLLWDSLTTLMALKEFDPFRLVGGTALSLQQGHRKSVDIDLFTDKEYGSVDFGQLDEVLKQTFPYVQSPIAGEIAFGTSYFIGENQDKAIKLDLFYTDPFAFPLLDVMNIRLASTREIAAMKLEVIANGGRKKDFWDLHELLDVYTIEEMFGFYKTRNPYGATTQELLAACLNHSLADEDFTPNCYRNKAWELIKLDLVEQVEKLS
ncbi:nucleotidyl transferase AbiEii/AbiGii toxin family protein [Robertkochia sediminum]|uniref:nucleotidyl transferase AbiEii/AbiGii toxin family protein n=1 Tax=Robertkochia sediminum TaxID=2785326 RepID=UPI001932C024|nr:nucleotidyl transferase AbiEii/AbiGii toxin family protein [Robertkochia sediminum]MBL7472941.1 nucleotidyl transferase AbiEii/AbiGii toxin family protein [Robertkochia sediminum]